MTTVSTPPTKESSEIWVGIDPGTCKTGLSLFEGTRLIESKVVRVPAGREMIERTLLMGDRVSAEVALMLPRRDPRTINIVFETPGYQGKAHARGLVGMGIGMGCVNYALYSAGYKMHHITVSEWSRLGGGRCRSKEHRADLIVKLFPGYDPTKDKGLDAADAIGIVAWKLGMLASY